MTGRTPALSLAKLAVFGSLSLPLAVATYPLLIYLPTFYGKDMGLGLASVGLILLAIRAWDAITDPTIGYLSDHWYSRAGRRRIWVACGAPLATFALYQLFVPPDHVDKVYLLSWALLFYLGWTLIQVPYSAWAAEMSEEFHQRSNITAAVQTFTVIGTVAAAVAAVIFNDSTRSVLEFIAWAIVILLPLFAGLVIWRIPDPPPRCHRPLSIGNSIHRLRQNPYSRQLLTAYVLNGIGNALPATLVLLYIEFVLRLPDSTGVFLGALFASSILGIPFWLALSRRTDKHHAWWWAILVASVTFACVPFLDPGNYWPYMAVCVISGFCFGADAILPPSMYADVVDADTARDGAAQTGWYFGIWGVATKFALAVPVGVAFPLLEFSGFSPNGDNTATELLWLTLCYSILPVPFKLTAMWVIRHFPLDHITQQELRRSIALQRATTTSNLPH